MSFHENGFTVIPNILPLEFCDFVADQMSLVESRAYSARKMTKGKELIGDTTVRNCFAWDQGPLDALLTKLQPVVETITGKELYPTYSYSRIYYAGAELIRHRDRPSCEYSVTITLRAEGNIWPIWFRSLKREVFSLYLNPGHGAVYKGCECTHWREKYTEGTQQYQVFLHYVDKNGRYSNYKYDRRAGLGLHPVTG